MALEPVVWPRSELLKRMAKMGWKIDEAIAEPMHVNVTPPDLSYKHPAYIQYVQSWLKDNFTDAQLYGSGLQVFTAMDVLVQRKTEQVFKTELEFLRKAAKLQNNPPLEAAATVIEEEQESDAAQFKKRSKANDLQVSWQDKHR